MSDDKVYKCPVCQGKGYYFLEGDLHRSGGNIGCYACNRKGYLTEVEHIKFENERTEFNSVIKGEPPRSGIFSKKLKGS